MYKIKEKSIPLGSATTTVGGAVVTDTEGKSVVLKRLKMEGVPRWVGRGGVGEGGGEEGGGGSADLASFPNITRHFSKRRCVLETITTTPM